MRLGGGGKTEIVGAFAYSGIGGDRSLTPMYVVQDSSLSVRMGGAHFARRRRPYVDLVKETHGRQARKLPAASCPFRAGFRAIPLYVGHPHE